MKIHIAATGMDRAQNEPQLPESLTANLPDETLVARVLGGDRDAFETLVRRHQAFLFRRAHWMGLDKESAADMVQDALVKAYTNLATCRDPSRFGYWVGRILRNGILDLLKSPSRRGVPLSLSLPSGSEEPLGEEGQAALRNCLGEALAALPQEQREAFLLKHAEGCSYEEMAELTQTSVSALKMRVLRARETLRAQLAGFAGKSM